MTRTVVLDILKANGLEGPDARPLYAYRLTEAQLRDLAFHLRAAFARAATAQPWDGAAFCIFAAHHFCATHTSGAWAWDTIFAAIGYDGALPLVYDAVRAGLRYWRRPMLRDRSRGNSGSTLYLLTLGCEGGLPRSLIHDEHDRPLVRYLRALLENAEAFGHSAATYTTLYRSMLPRVFRHHAVYTLCADLVDALVDLRAALRAAGNVADPIDALDKLNSAWRSKVPLHLDDKTAAGLLRGLLATPRAEVSTSRRWFSILTQLRVTDRGMRLSRTVRARGSATPADVATLLGVEETALLPRIVLMLESPTGDRLHAATLQRDQATNAYRLEHIADRGLSIGFATPGPTVLIAVASGREFARCVPEGGEALSTDEPWAFVEDGDAWNLESVGSFQTTAAIGRVVLSAGATIDVQRGTFDRELSNEGFALLRLSGASVVRVGESSFSLETGVEEPRKRHWRIAGRLAADALETWIGTPSIWESLEGGAEHPVGAHRLEWRAASPNPQGSRSIAQAFGRGTIRVVENGTAVYRRQCTILPADFSYRLNPGAKRDAGSIVVTGSDLTEVGVAPVEGVTATTTQHGAEFVVRLERAEPCITRISLRLRSRRGDVATIDVPFPALDCAFYRGTASRLRSRDRLALHRLSSARAEATAPSTNGPRFAVLGRPASGGPTVALGELDTQPGNVQALSLHSVRSLIEVLLASGDGLDSTAELLLEPLVGVPNPKARIEVGFFDLEFATPAVTPCDQLSLPAVVPSDLRVDDLEVELVSMLRPDQPAKPLPRHGEGWKLDRSTLSPGPWLILGRVGSLLRVRPLLITVDQPEASAGETGAPLETETSALVRAIGMNERDERRSALRDCIDDLVSQPGHADWAMLGRLVDLTDLVPAPTFDALRALAANPTASALAVLRVSNGARQRYWSALAALGVAWGVLPVKSWLRALAQLRLWLEAQQRELSSLDLDVELATEHLDDLVAFARRVSPVLSLLLEVVSLDWPALAGVAGMRSLPQCHHQVGKPHGEVTSKLCPELLARQAEAWWPTSNPALYDALREFDADSARRAQPYRLCNLPYQQDALDAPVVAAITAVRGQTLPPSLEFQIRRLRAFDPEWFDNAQALVVGQLLAQSPAKEWTP